MGVKRVPFFPPQIFVRNIFPFIYAFCGLHASYSRRAWRNACSLHRVCYCCSILTKTGMYRPLLVNGKLCQLQWPRGLGHELSSLAWTLGSWVRIPLKALISVCVYSGFVLFCVGSGLVTGWSPVQGVLPTVYWIKKLKMRQRSKKGLQNHRQITVHYPCT
jgi:hypothetical protein